MACLPVFPWFLHTLADLTFDGHVSVLWKSVEQCFNAVHAYQYDLAYCVLKSIFNTTINHCETNKEGERSIDNN